MGLDTRSCTEAANEACDSLLGRGIAMNRTSFTRGFGEGATYRLEQAKARIHWMIERWEKTSHPDRTASYHHIEGLKQAWGLLSEIPDWLIKESAEKSAKQAAPKAPVDEI